MANQDAYFSEEGDVMYTADGTPLCYWAHATNTFHRYEGGSGAFYYDLLSPMTNADANRIRNPTPLTRADAVTLSLHMQRRHV